MKRFFQGLLQPALDIVGVFDVFTTTLQILFLPVALQILDWALWLMDRVGGLSEFWKKFIGWVALGGVILGTALTIASIPLSTPKKPICVIMKSFSFRASFFRASLISIGVNIGVPNRIRFISASGYHSRKMADISMFIMINLACKFLYHCINSVEPWL